MEDKQPTDPIELVQFLNRKLAEIRKAKGFDQSPSSSSIFEIGSMADVNKVLAEVEEHMPTAELPAPKILAAQLSKHESKLFVPGQTVRLALTKGLHYIRPPQGTPMVVTQTFDPPQVEIDEGFVSITDTCCAFFYTKGAEIHVLEFGFDSRFLELVDANDPGGFNDE